MKSTMITHLEVRERRVFGTRTQRFFEGKDGKTVYGVPIHTDYDKPSGDRRACIAEVYFDEAGKMRFRL